MRSMLVALFAGAMLVGVAGCQKDKHETDSHNPKMMKTTDACSHCPGDQMATADGKCSKCGMKVQS